MLTKVATTIGALLCLSAAVAAQTVPDDHWADGMGYPGPYNSAAAVVVDASGCVYVGGNFTGVGNILANGIAKWDPATGTWSTLGTGVAGSVGSLAMDGSGNLYVGGSFTSAGGVSANNIAKWDPVTSTWSALGSGTNNPVCALQIDASGCLYVGGQFTTAGDVIVNYVAKWDPNAATWSALAGGVSNYAYYVRALALDGDGNLYVAGLFLKAGAIAANNIAMWTPATSSWSALGAGIPGNVYSLAWKNNNELYVGGVFRPDGEIMSGSHVVLWNRNMSSWSAVGGALPMTLASIATDGDGELYAGGSSSLACVVKWNSGASAWEAVGSPPIAGIAAKLTCDSAGDVLVPGFFYGPSYRNIAKWNATTLSWERLGSGPSACVGAFAVSCDGTIYGGGEFTAADGSATRVAVWNRDTEAWDGLVSANGFVNALVMDRNGKLYAGGSFSTIGGISAARVAVWDPVTSAWSALGSGTSGTVNALALSSAGELYVGGSFVTAGGVTVNNVAKWSPSSSQWSALGVSYGPGTGSWGLDGAVYALAVAPSGALIAGGSFTNSLAQYRSPNGWSVFDGSMTGAVYTLALDGVGGLYVGGSGIGGVIGENLMRFWTSNYGSGWEGWYKDQTFLTTGVVYSVAVAPNGTVYAGGSFTSIMPLVPANRIIAIDPLTWHSNALGSGLDGSATDIVCDHAGNVFVGGGFFIAGGKVSANFARWQNQVPVNMALPVVSGSRAPGLQLSATTGSWNELDGDNLNFSYKWRRASSVTGTDAYNISDATSSSFTVTDDLVGAYVAVRVAVNDGCGGFSNAQSAWTLVQPSASTDTSAVSVSADAIPADGVSTTTVTVQLKDAAGNNLTGSGGVVAISATGGTPSAAADNGDGTYTATLTSSSTPGVVTVSATINGAAISATASVTFKGSQAISFGALSAKTYGAADFDLSASATSSLPVSFTSSDENVATVSGKTVHIVGAGSTTFTASQGGNLVWNAAANVSRALTVNKASQTISFGALSPKKYGDVDFDLNASATSSLPVSFTSSDENVATVSGKTVHIVGAGSTTFMASQNGNALWNAAASVSQALAVRPGEAPLLTSFLSTAAVRGVPFTYALAATGAQPIVFSAADLPRGLSCNAGVISGTPEVAGVALVTLSATNLFGADTRTLRLTIGHGAGDTESAPALVSPPAVDTSLGMAGGTLSFSLAASDAEGDLLAYSWDFGDGGSGSGANCAHVFTVPGVYTVHVTVSDGAQSTTSALTVVVCAAQETGGEADPAWAASAANSFKITKGSVRFTFASPQKDSLSLSGMVPVAKAFAPAGRKATVLIGGFTKVFVLNARGQGGAGASKFQLSGKLKNGVFSATPAKFTLSVKGEPLFESLRALGFESGASVGVVEMPVILLIGETALQASKRFQYKATSKSGSGK